MSISYERKKQIYDHYKAEKDITESQSIEMGGRSARANLTITAGALVLSITFLSSVANALNPAYLWALGLGWLLLIISLAATLGAQAASQGGLEWNCSWLDERMEELSEKPPECRNPFWLWVKIQRNVALMTCIIGISLLALFAYLSAKAQTTEINEQSKRSTEIQRRQANQSAIGEEASPTSPTSAEGELIK